MKRSFLIGLMMFFSISLFSQINPKFEIGVDYKYLSLPRILNHDNINTDNIFSHAPGIFVNYYFIRKPLKKFFFSVQSFYTQEKYNFKWWPNGTMEDSYIFRNLYMANTIGYSSEILWRFQISINVGIYTQFILSNQMIILKKPDGPIQPFHHIDPNFLTTKAQVNKGGSAEISYFITNKFKLSCGYSLIYERYKILTSWDTSANIYFKTIGNKYGFMFKLSYCL